MTDLRGAWRALVQRHVQDANAPRTARIWAPDLEQAPRDQLAAMQLEKARAAYALLWAHSPFYRAKFERAGLGDDVLRNYADLRRVPITRPEEWVVDQESHSPWGSFSPLRDADWIERGWMMFSTSGTKARVPRLFRHTTFDREQWTWHGARALYAMGVRRGDIALNCSAYGTSVAYWGLHYALNHMGIPVISGAGATSERRAMLIDHCRPTVLLATPSYVLTLGREMEAAGLSPRDSSVRLLVCAGEPGPCVPATKKRIEELWGAVVHDDFGCTEVAMSPLGYTCDAQAARTDGVDVHLMEDQYIVEVLDPVTHEPVPDGTRGTLVVSNLFSEAQPILRFAMGDWIAITRDVCACGRTHARALGGLQGRSDDLLKIKGLKFFPAALEDAIRAVPELGDEFRIEISRVDDADRVTITVEPASGTTRDALDRRIPAIVRRLKSALGIEVAVVGVDGGTLPRVMAKAKRLFDLR